MRILIDTNVIMDFIVMREPFTSNAKQVIDICMDKNIDVSIAAHSIPNLFYILQKHLTIEQRRDILLKLCKMFDIIGIDANKLEHALNNHQFKDFEDCLQDICAKEFAADFILTRNTNDFTSSLVPAIEPIDFIKIVAKIANT
ncbi:MAG: PIN domain-containing protein [Defluviitaleaceae bacterium]|nr:PIN domain-containing protein [Defluviitaleaceae bacterium]